MLIPRLPEHISYHSAALLEPLSVAIHAVSRAAPVPGSTALVMGAGTIGLLTAAMARQSGCTTVAITDLDAGRVEYAISRGFATHGYVIPKQLRLSSADTSGISTPSLGSNTPNSIFSAAGQFDIPKAIASEILCRAFREDAGCGPEEGAEDEFDVTFECTGKEVCMHTGLYATKAGGKVIMVGMGTPVQTLPLSVAHLGEIDILGIFRYANTYATGIRLLCSRGNGGGSGSAMPSLDDMVTHRFKGLDNARGAFELASRTEDADGNLVLKVIIEA